MAQVVTVPSPEPVVPHNHHYGLPPFAIPMMVLFGVYLVWILLAGLVLFIIS